MSMKTLNYPASTLKFLAIQPMPSGENTVRHFQTLEQISEAIWDSKKPLIVFELGKMQIYSIKPATLILEVRE